MATSGTFSTSNQYVKYAIEMIENSTNTAANTSNVTVRVWAWRTNTYGPTYGTGTCYCTIAGTQYTAGITSSQHIDTTWIKLFEKTLDIAHNSDGGYRLETSAHITMDVVTSSDQGWGFDLTTIPRASTPTLSATTFNMGDTITIYTNRKSSSFVQVVKYVFGGASGTIANDFIDSCTWTAPTSLAQQIPNATAGIGSIIIDTYSGGTYIGSNSVGFTVNCPSSMVPTATSLTKSIFGTGRDKTLNKYVQSITKITASFTATATNYATVASSTITVKRQSDNADLQTISGASGTTANPVGLSGTYIIIGTVTDSRGRTATVSTTITVDAYSPPTVTTFTTARNATTSTTVNATLNISWGLAASNPTTVTVKGKNNVGTEVTLYTLTNSTAGVVNTTQNYTSQADASSYTYTLTMTDSFGNVATATATVGTSFAEFTIAKGKGVGVAKVWAQGALDVGGDIYEKNVKLEDKYSPSGLVQMWAGAYASPPSGWLLCAGQAVSRTTYSKLFAVIGTSFGAGDGSTTFNVPNLVGKVPVGLSTGETEFNTIGKTGGEKTHKLTQAEMPAHSHTDRIAWGDGTGNRLVGSGNDWIKIDYGINVGVTGGDGFHNNLQPYLTINFIIKY